MEACFNKRRRCIACDIDPAMMLHARQRWEAIKRRVYDDLHEDAAGAVPMPNRRNTTPCRMLLCKELNEGVSAGHANLYHFTTTEIAK